MSKATIVLVVLGLAAACGKDQDVTPPTDRTAEPIAKESAGPAAATPPAPASQPASQPDNQIDLAFSGAFTAKLQGKGGLCSLRKGGPMPGATWQVRSSELGAATPSFDVTIISENTSFDDPTIVVNVTGEPRASYARHRGKPDAKLVVAHDATSAEVDILLKRVGTAGTDLHMVGSIRCASPRVFP